MTDRRVKLLTNQSSNLHFTDPYLRHEFVRDDNEFPSLTTSKKLKDAVQPKHTNFVSHSKKVAISYSSKLKTTRTSDEEVLLQNEKIRNLNDYSFKNGRTKQKQTLENLAHGYAGSSSSSKSNQEKHSWENYSVKSPVDKATKNFKTGKQDMTDFECSNNKKKLDNRVLLQNTNIAHSSKTSSNYQSNFKRENDYKSNFESKTLQINQSNKVATATNAINQVKDNLDVDSKAKIKKKNRKSKVKRDTAMQSGKILVLTQEAHSRILNKTNGFVPSRTNLNTTVNIDDDKEYPDLSQAITQKVNVSSAKSFVIRGNKKLNSINFSSFGLSEESNKTESNENQEPKQSTSVVQQRSFPTSSEVILDGAKKKRGDEETLAHPPSSITIPFQDMLFVKSKTKEARHKVTYSSVNSNIKPKPKKIVVHHNILDSTPAVKRGKEREAPKPKRKTPLKKIILIDRQQRKERHLLAKEQVKDSDQMENLNESSEEHLYLSSESSLRTEFLSESCDVLIPFNVIEEELQKLQINCDEALENENISQNGNKLYLSNCENMTIGENCNINVDDNINGATSELSNANKQNYSHIQLEGNVRESHNLQLNEAVCHPPLNYSLDLEAQKNSSGFLEITENTQNISENSSSNSALVPTFSEKEKLQAAKIVIHTRSFRPYCTNIICKELEKSVLALLDDLIRFQDRLHHKDPTKARIKRRLVYGIKEVMKNLKLKKIKCILIAMNIENVESEGGLNDTIANLISSAADHYVPCVFALNRKVLGRACHKPVGISCVGIFNYEGSETNFKKMIELRNLGQKDYMELQNSVMEILDDTLIENLFKTSKDSPENLRSLREAILSDIRITKESNEI